MKKRNKKPAVLKVVTVHSHCCSIHVYSTFMFLTSKHTPGLLQQPNRWSSSAATVKRCLQMSLLCLVPPVATNGKDENQSLENLDEIISIEMRPATSWKGRGRPETAFYLWLSYPVHFPQSPGCLCLQGSPRSILSAGLGSIDIIIVSALLCGSDLNGVL